MPYSWLAWVSPAQIIVFLNQLSTLYCRFCHCSCAIYRIGLGQSCTNYCFSKPTFHALLQILSLFLCHISHGPGPVLHELLFILTNFLCFIADFVSVPVPYIWLAWVSSARTIPILKQLFTIHYRMRLWSCRRHCMGLGQSCPNNSNSKTAFYYSLQNVSLIMSQTPHEPRSVLPEQFQF